MYPNATDGRSTNPGSPYLKSQLNLFWLVPYKICTSLYIQFQYKQSGFTCLRFKLSVLLQTLNYSQSLEYLRLTQNKKVVSCKLSSRQCWTSTFLRVQVGFLCTSSLCLLPLRSLLISFNDPVYVVQKYDITSYTSLCIW